MPATNPISHADPTVLARVLALDPATQAEERLQGLLYLWLARYFTGVAFDTAAAGGGTEEKTFQACELDFQTGRRPEGAQLARIHVVLPERSATRCDHSAGETGHDDDWTLTVLVQAPAVVSGTALDGDDGDDTARRVAGQLEWLFSSAERVALVEQGVTRMRIERPAVIVPPTDGWRARMLVVSCRTRRAQAKLTS